MNMNVNVTHPLPLVFILRSKFKLCTLTLIQIVTLLFNLLI